jgi:hypothetical protein
MPSVISPNLESLTLHYYRSPQDLPAPPKLGDLSYVQREWRQYHARFARTVQLLEQAAVFVPCLSPPMVRQCWQDSQTHPRLQSLLTDPPFLTFPVLLHALVGAPKRVRPLASYVCPDTREAVCAQIVHQMETRIRKQYRLAAYTPEALRSRRWV